PRQTQLETRFRFGARISSEGRDNRRLGGAHLEKEKHEEEQDEQDAANCKRDGVFSHDEILKSGSAVQERTNFLLGGSIGRLSRRSGRSFSSRFNWTTS